MDKLRLKEHKTEGMLLIILIATFLLFTFLAPGRFMTASNLSSMTFQMPELGLLALAMMAPVLTAGINLSIATTATLSSIIAAYVLTSGLALTQPILAIVLAIAVSMIVAVLLGSINGFFVSVVGAAPMLVTLGTMTLFEGIGLNLTKGGAVSGFSPEFSFLGNGSIFGVPVPLLVYVIVVIISYLLIEKSKWGIEVHMLGSNGIATKYSGVNNLKVLFTVYIYSAMMSAIAGMIMISRYNSAKTDYGSSYVMQAVTAAVLGGTSIYGGVGTVLGTVLAVGIIQMISTGLNIVGVNRNIVDIVIGAILIAILLIRAYADIRADRNLIETRKKSSSNKKEGKNEENS